MYVVYVQTKDGQPLDPTTRFGKVRRMLKDGRAVVVQRKPFTIRLTYRIETPVTHRYIGGTDPGRTNIGNAVLRKEDGRVIYTDHVQTNNKDVPKHMAKRADHRHGSRKGERQRRKRRAKANDTLSTKLTDGRKLPGCEETVPVKDIINTEARFANRKRHSDMGDVILGEEAGWLTPTAKQLVQTHLNHIDQIRRLLPVTDWCLEVNRFAFMQMEDGSVQGVDFQSGRLKGFPDAHAYIDFIQDGKCAVCGSPIGHHHHLIPKHAGGSDTPENLVGLCLTCHKGVHTGAVSLSAIGKKKRYGALSVLNQTIPYLLLGLIERFGEDHVWVCNGRETALARELYHIPKDHPEDAAAIIAACTGTEPVFGSEVRYEVKQFRRHDRAIVKRQTERTYKLDGVTVAKNRKPRYEQKGPALNDWFDRQAAERGIREAERMRSRLTVKKSTRSYNLPQGKRLMPGAAFRYQGKRYVLQGREGNGRYLIPYGRTRVPASECTVFAHNTGLVYL